MRLLLTAGSIGLLLTATLATSAVAQEAEADPSSDAAALLRMHDARISFTATLLADGSVLVTGGNDGLTVHRSAEVFDPASRTFRQVGAMAYPRFGHTATALPDGRVLILGGAFTGTPEGLLSVEIYDPATETFSGLGDLQEPRFAHAAALLDDGRVLVTGGIRETDDDLRFRDSAEVFDPATGRSKTVGPMRTERMMHAAVPLEDGGIAVIGGFGTREPGERTLEVFDLTTERFEGRPDFVVPVERPHATRLHDCRILITSSHSILLAADATSSELLEDVPPRRGRATTTLLGDGRVLAIGGASDGPTPVALFDPTTDTFSPADPLRSERGEHVATLLDNGTVLVVGGFSTSNACQPILTSAEIWDPSLMKSVAVGEEAGCEAATFPALPSLPPLGAETTGGRIEMPGSAFAITIPDDWTVELADPDPDLFAAEPGSAWEAMRATHPEGTQACSMSVGVADVSLLQASGAASGGVRVPMWHPDEPGILMVPDPRVAEAVEQSSSTSPMDRLARGHDGLEHDALYVLECANVPEGRFEQIMHSVEFLPHGE